MVLVSCKTSAPSSSGAKLPESIRIKLAGLFIDANKEKILGNDQKALYLFEKCLSIDPKNDAVCFELSKLHSNLKNQALFNYKRAYTYAQMACLLDEKNVWYLEHMALLYELNGKTGEAAKVYQKLIGLQDYNLEYYARLAQTYEYDKRYKEAIEVYQTIENKTSVSDLTSFKKSDLYLIIGENQKAIDELEKLIQNNPNVPDYYQKLAECYLKQKDEEGAKKVYERLEIIEPNEPSIHLFLANYYGQKGDRPRALTEMKLAFENKELDIDRKIEILLNFYVASETNDDYKKESLELVDILTKTHPTDPKSYTMAGDFYMRDTNYVKARESFLKALEFDKTRYAIWNQMFVIDSELKNYVELAQLTKEAKDYFPTQPIVYYFNGFALSQQKQYDLSAKSLEEGLDFVVGNQALEMQFYALLGDVYNSTKNYAKSDAFFEKALVIDPNSAFVMNNYAYYLSVRKDQLEKAKMMSKKTLDQEPNSSTYADTYAWILYQNQEYDQALIWMEKAMSFPGGKSGVIIEHYGDVLYRLGRKDEALIQWKKAKSIGDTSEFMDKKISEGVLYE